MDREWGELEKRSVLAFLRRVMDAATGWLHEEARSLLRLLDPPTSLPPETHGDKTSSETIANSETRKDRRAAVAAQLAYATKKRLPASAIEIPGVNDRTAKAKFLSRCVADGMLTRIPGYPPLYKLNTKR